MPGQVSVDELQRDIVAVVAAIAAGESVVVTVDGLPAFDIVPRGYYQSPWVSSHVLRRIREDTPADPGLLVDLEAVRGGVIDQ